MYQYPAIAALIDDVTQKLERLDQVLPSAYPSRLHEMFTQCYPNTLTTTVELLEDGTTFVVTGDIPAMWLRDSSAQVNPYIHLAKEDQALQRMLRGLIQRQAQYILLDPYANAFNREPNGQGHKGDQPPAGLWVWERKFELDSLCYPIKLCYRYWQHTGDMSIFNESVHTMLRKVVEIMRIEQHHDTRSSYTFERPDPLLPSDTLPRKGRGTPTPYTGMVWSGFRPSDDACKYGYLIPANMFAVVVLGYASEIARIQYQDESLAQEAEALCQEIESAIETYGIVEHPRYGRIYAYETDGYGNYNLMDDANVPSLLSIPYLGYRPMDDALYQNTRRFVLSSDNPYYYEGKYAYGIGSPHTPNGYIWPIALSMSGLTTTDPTEQQKIAALLVNTTANTGYMHESFHPDDPQHFTRPWFAWANSLFGEFVQSFVTNLPTSLAPERRKP
ncbi:glycoside hydrolase family 125 protein [Ktedonospora formicarum]|uniref:Glycosyl hydrolase n=1 Tax=Ktedonospora formicarum TaxID=2778364 RepID=A0A8J3I892_9CHLR|nr:glycoside hydrolase family 125 protein [Ktedonospora formicarum]GHO49013.1 glycosyl hydrolase [Ktedonospora formicarum]